MSYESIAYANIGLFSENDSAPLTGTISNEEGIFSIQDIKTGKYRIKISFIGYQSVIIDNVLLQPGTRELGKIALEVLSENLDELTIVSTKPPMTYKVDRKVIDAGSFPGADAAIDLLENVPSVQLDLEGNLTYRGEGTFKVYINGHPAANGTEKLRQLPASRIDKIEVITNPSAKYDAEGTAGIIQIILKKNRLEGYAINTSLKADTRSAYQWMFSIDNKNEKNGWYLNTYWSGDVWEKYNENSRQTIIDDEITYNTTSEIKSKHGQTNSNIEMGFNYDLTNKDYIDFSGYVNPTKTKQKNRKKGWVTEQITNKNGETTDSTYYLNSLYNCNYQYVGGTLTYEHTFKKDRSHLFSAYIDYSGYVTDLFDRQYDQQIYDTFTKREGFIGSEHQETTIEGKLNYKIPLNKKITMETGAEISTDHIPEITSKSGTFDANKNITKYDDAPINQIVDFIQDVYSPYILLKREGEKMAIQAGIRVEFTNRRSDYSFENEAGIRVTTPTRNRFTDFFPSVHTTYNFSETQQIFTSYSRRIQRPNYWKLVPLEQYETPYSYYTGNDDVLPSYTNAWETGFKKSWDKNFISTEIFTRKTMNVTQNYSHTSAGNMLVISPENVGQSWSTGIELMGGAYIFPWWNANLSASLYSYKLNINFEKIQKTQKQFKTDTRWNNTFLLPKLFTLKWDLKYNSPYQSAQTKRDAFFVSNLALKKEFCEGKWIITVVYNDIFSSEKYTTTKTGEGFFIKTQYKEEPYFSFKLAYIFDNQK
ncbi:TonB-dependent receptor [Maribellus maritimus]|nr:TonB-dependent receptor [Maribellus maritimus]